MPSYRVAIDEDQRLKILQALAADSEYTQNEDILRAALKYAGHNISGDKLLTELNWLEEQGLIIIEKIGELALAKITRRGLDVAGGATTAPGVAKPKPE